MSNVEALPSSRAGYFCVMHFSITNIFKEVNIARPSVFIGSSSEGLKVARNVKAQLSNDAEVTIWHEGVFGGLTKARLKVC